MGKKTSKIKSACRERDAPVTRGIVNPELFRMFVGVGDYVSLSDCPEVKMCAHIYADMVSNMTIHLMKNTPSGDVREVNELSRMIDISPNRYMNRKSFIYNIVYTMLLAGDGNQITVPRYSTDGYLRELLPLKPSGVSIISAGNDYVINYNGNTYMPDEVLHFAVNPDPEEPWRGTGLRMYLRDAVKCIKQAGATKRALMESPTPSIIVKVDGLTEDFASVAGRKALREQYIDSQENGQPWFIPAEAFDVVQVKPLTLADLAIKDSLELDRRTVAGLFGVPPFVVGVGTYNEDEFNNFINSRIVGIAQYIQQELTRKLLFSHDMYFKFNPRSLYNYKLTDLIAAGKDMIDRMAMRRNEWRDWVGLAPDAEMEVLLALENYIPADRLGDQKKLNGGE